MAVLTRAGSQPCAWIVPSAFLVCQLRWLAVSTPEVRLEHQNDDRSPIHVVLYAQSPVDRQWRVTGILGEDVGLTQLSRRPRRTGCIVLRCQQIGPAVLTSNRWRELFEVVYTSIYFSKCQSDLLIKGFALVIAHCCSQSGPTSTRSADAQQLQHRPRPTPH